jgi:hypothetical protein
MISSPNMWLARCFGTLKSRRFVGVRGQLKSPLTCERAKSCKVESAWDARLTCCNSQVARVARKLQNRQASATCNSCNLCLEDKLQVAWMQPKKCVNT